MTAVKLNLPVIEQGATYNHKLTWLQPDQTPVNMSNCTARMQIRETYSSLPLVDLTTENGGIIINTSTGDIQLSISSDITTNLTPIKNALYDLEIYFTEQIVRLVQGKITISAEVTHD